MMGYILRVTDIKSKIPNFEKNQTNDEIEIGCLLRVRFISDQDEANLNVLSGMFLISFYKPFINPRPLSTQPILFFKLSLNVNKGLSFKKRGDQVLISMVNLMMNSKDLVSISMSQCINMLESEFFQTIKLILFVQLYQTASEQDIRSLRTIKSGVILDSLERIFKISFMPNVISV